MGMFDTVLMDCPTCGGEEKFKFQSKSGPCVLGEYRTDTVPASVAAGLIDEPTWGVCDACGAHHYVTATVQLRLVSREEYVQENPGMEFFA